ncbi:NUDIX hydrolase family protein [Tieghemostelium lacteum]|uniref:NUDIX hydrolase family protein n=1 Tax=Tieghemostelium lacteum TaxID=361077 RepID=A0A151ZCS9_TIELA|nr:NUDIX hydrolase family protein [Tieghemostelium lacteum]|eukprot:KYQ91741.1 NUDIX hydrolase family protein [Tieghemostelium lacteum]
MNSPTLRLCVGALVFNQDNEVLLCRRSSNKKIEVGKWQFPQGGVNPGEDNYNAVIREIKEEIGLDVSLESLRYVSRIEQPLSYMFPDPEGRHHHGQLIHWYLFHLPKSMSNLINLNVEDPPEFDQFQWIPFQTYIDQPHMMVGFKIEMYRNLFLESQPIISHFLIDLNVTNN